MEPPGVPLTPDRKQVLDALKELWHPFEDFPFANDVARGAMLSAILSAVIRRSLPTCPGHIFDAPVMGSGKTLLARCMAALAGHVAEPGVPPSDDEEARKSLFAALREGAGCIIWDNVIHPLDGAAINSFLTAEIFKDRILGLSQSEALPNSALFLATGNNVRVVGDAARRFVVCRIDAKLERPYLREFPFDPLQWVTAKRMEMVTAALTLVRGYIAAGRPRMAPGNTASFERWDELVRQVVCWVGTFDSNPGFGDPMQTIEKNDAEDPQKGLLRLVLEAWHGYFGATAKTSTEVTETLDGGITAQDEQEAHTAFVTAIAAGLSSSSRGDATPVRLGRYLAKHEDEIVAGYVLRAQYDTHKKVKRWRVEQVGEVA
jgi:hypothetical protein